MDEDCRLYGLVYECPYQQRKEGCLLKEFDCFTFYEKVCCINRLTQDERKEIIKKHFNCSKNRV